MDVRHHRCSADRVADRIAIAAAFCLLGGCTAPLGSTSQPPPPSRAESGSDPQPEASAPAAQPPATQTCRHAEGDDAKRFEYEAFGPAAMSFALLGQAWWQWDSEGHAFEESGGTIWVVVHDGLDGDALATRFPVLEEEQCDQRYVTLADARAYLQEHVDELADPEVSEFAPLRAKLQRTLADVDAHFD